AGVAVGGFFVISGFLLTWSLDRNPDLKAFALKRFFRIYPLYAVVILIQAVVLVAEVGTLRGGIATELLRYLGANLVFANFLQPTIGETLAGLRLDAINGSAWTLKVEIACYIALPFVLAAQRRLGIAFTAGLALLLAGYPLLSGGAGGPHAAIYLGLASFFLTGSLLYRWGHHLDRYQALFLPLGIVGAPLVVLGASSVMRVPIGAQVVVGLWVYCVAFAGRTIAVKDDISYGAYLLHFPLIQLGLLHGLLFDEVLLSTALVVLATTALAWLSFRHLERPMIRLGHRLSREWPPRDLRSHRGSPDPGESR
ncbi:MAG: acyltransferase family protein, partial [Candidatus Limnocylindria bacterium]